MQTDTVHGICGKPIAWRKFPVSIWRLSIHPSYTAPYSIYLKSLKQNIVYIGGTTPETYTGHTGCLNVLGGGGGSGQRLWAPNHIFVGGGGGGGVDNKKVTGLSGRCFLPIGTGVITEASHMIFCAVARTNHKMVTSLSSDPYVTSTDPWEQGFVAPQVAGWSSTSQFQLKNMTCRLSEHPEYAVQFSFIVIFGQAFQHSVI